MLDEGRQALAIESQAISTLQERLDGSFVDAVRILDSCKGKVVVTGVGKSGIICRKIAATLSSTGTPALFLHPTEGLHGDLGILSRNDVIIAISYSGNTEELVKIVPAIKRFGLPLISMTGNLQSELASNSDVVLNIQVSREACPLGLAPTASTTATLAMGDALASVLLVAKGFSEEDFALRHPGGTLGKRLLLRVQDVMHTGGKIPLVKEQTSMHETLLEITGKGLGITGVTTAAGRLIGVITDGDLRRTLERQDNLLSLLAADVMTRNPKRIFAHVLATQALRMMEEHSITSVFVVNRDDEDLPVGILHLHDLLQAGVV
ncbi:MAG: KpsF/GutQ family sugar-phosphate isomerase [Deltaproteobacteria bacterium]|nr:KpsF/GutQ family sugar-phosphate isomerase [Candidatus Anaeroferrophillus wilburensis]MBN2889454.1 KpsF/GutQ family sugar-phosphate isomerase [Deltaproteobacteria bacterium]